MSARPARANKKGGMMIPFRTRTAREKIKRA
jgi:hypothetical protein